MKPASPRGFLRRALERGDPRLALLVGLPLTLAVAAAFAGGLGGARRLDDAILDQAFRWRAPIRESPDLLLVDMNDETFQQLTWPIQRSQYAGVLYALTRLGARHVVFDVQFKTVLPRPGEYDPETGEYLLDEKTRMLRAALGLAGNVTLAYHFQMRDELSPPLREAFPRIRSALEKDFAAGPGAVARAAGVPEQEVADEFNALRKEVAQTLAVEKLERRPDLAFADFRKEVLPSASVRRDKEPLKYLHFGYWAARGARLIRERGVRASLAGLPPGAGRVHDLWPPLYPLLEMAAGAAAANADADADGVLRRPWAFLVHGGHPYPYLGLDGAVRGRRDPAHAGLEIHPDALIVAGQSPAVLPLDREGRILVNWAGNRNRRRGRDETYFAHLPFHDLLGFYEERYVHMDANFRRVIADRSEAGGEPYHPDYLRMSDRLRDIMEGKAAASGTEARALEDRLDAIRGGIVQDVKAEIAEAGRGLAAVQGDRLKKRLEEHRDRQKAILEGLLEPRELEDRIRPRVAEKICWIGSAGTAGGDLHATPLAFSTPGMDALANVANMALTGQAIRRVPPAVDLAYLFVVGLLVSLAVTGKSTTLSALQAAGLMAASLALYGALFGGAGILVSGAGPLVAAGFSFAGTTAFKELVTQRSKRKLQRELEKNTSPELVAILIEHPELLAQPRKMAGTLFFSDVKSFTSISEEMDAEVLVPFINRYLDRMTRALLRRKAYLDKYIGDGIMALFGMPVAYPEHARNACLAALECQALLRDLNAEFARDGLPQLRSRIGIHSGEVIAGYVGASDRANYTVLGDTVNLASRLEGANKEYGSAIMISEATLDLVRGQFAARELDRIRVVGKQNAVRIFELLAPAGGASPFPEGFLAAYEVALAAFKDRRWREAIGGFERALALKGGDKPCGTFLARANAFLVSPPPPGWEGVFELTSK